MRNYHSALDENKTPWRLAGAIIGVLAVGTWVMLALAAGLADRLVAWLMGG